MKKIKKILEVLSDIVMFAVGALAFAALGIVLGAFIAFMFVIALPVEAIYYAITDEMTLKDSYIEQLEIAFDNFKEFFKKQIEA